MTYTTIYDYYNIDNLLLQLNLGKQYEILVGYRDLCQSRNINRHLQNNKLICR